jgi:hypothetical protein
MKFLIELDPRKALLTRMLMTEQVLKFMLCPFLAFKVTSFTLYDAINFEEKRKKQDFNLQLGSTECELIKVLYWISNFNIN